MPGKIVSSGQKSPSTSSATGGAGRSGKPKPGAGSKMTPGEGASGKPTAKNPDKSSKTKEGPKKKSGQGSGKGKTKQAARDTATAAKAAASAPKTKRSPDQTRREFAKEKAVEGAVSTVASPAVGRAAAAFMQTETGKKLQSGAKKIAIVALCLSLFILSLPFIAIYAVVMRNSSQTDGFNNYVPSVAAQDDGLPSGLLTTYGDQAAHHGLPWEVVGALASVQTNYGLNAGDGEQRTVNDLLPSVNPPIATNGASPGATGSSAPTTATAEPTVTGTPTTISYWTESKTPVPATFAAGPVQIVPAVRTEPTAPPTTTPDSSVPDDVPTTPLPVPLADSTPRIGPFLIAADIGVSVERANDQAKASGLISALLASYLHENGGRDGAVMDVEATKGLWVAALDSLPVKGADPGGGENGSMWANGVADIAIAWQAGRSGKCDSGLGGIDLPTSGPIAVGDPLGGTAGNLTEEMMINAILIVRAGQASGANRQAMVIALITAITESNLINNPNMVDHTSVGLFQQQEWWGTYEQRMDPAYATNAFLYGANGNPGLFQIANWESMPLGVAAQAVQVSAFPDRYEVYVPSATALYDTIIGSGTAPVGPPTGTTPTPTTPGGPTPVSAGGVYVIGDSLTVGADQNGLNLPGATIDATNGLTTAAGISRLSAADLESIQTVVVALGTNDAGASKAAYGAQIDLMMETIGADKNVIWINVDASASALTAAANGVNPALEEAKSRHSNLVVADWHTHIDSQPDPASLRASDGVHYTPEGYELRAAWMTTVINGGVGSTTSGCGGLGGSGAAGGGCEGALLESALAAAPSEGAKIAIEAACSLLGLPYLWGGGHSLAEIQDPNPSGLDCSGYMAWAWYRAGVNIMGTTYAQIQMGEAVPSLDQARPGDLVFVNNTSHVGMYIGDGKYLNEPSTGDVAKVSDIPVDSISGIRRVG